MRLSDALAAMPPAAFERLLARRAVTLDPAKRLPASEQAARALAAISQKRLGQLPASAQEALRALVARPGRAPRASLGGGALPLVELGLVFPAPDEPDQLAMPGAYRLQLAAPASEDPRSARALLTSLDEEIYKAVALQRLGRPPVQPRPLVLGDVLAALESTAEVERTLASLPRAQQRLLAAIEARGGELTGQELLDLSKEPARWGPAHTLPRRGVAWELVTRALLLPHGRDSYALPAEVAAVVGRERRAVALRVREDVARRIATSDDDPARARFGDDPGPVAAALLAELVARRELPNDGSQAVRRSALRAAARSLAIEPERAELLVALARASRVTSVAIADLRARLFATWRASGAWDEARTEPDRLRATEPAVSRATPTAALREALLEVLASLPEGRFAPLEDVLRATRADLRCDPAARLLERAAQGAGDAFVSDPGIVLRALVERSLPALGALDRGDGGRVRLSAFARTALRGSPARARPQVGEPAARWESGARLRVSKAVELGRVLAFAPLGALLPHEDRVVFVLDRARVQEAADRGELDALRGELEALAPLDDAASRALTVEVRRVVACELVAASAYVAIPDDALRGAAQADEAIAPLVARVLPGGLLLREGASIAVLERRLTRLGGTLGRGSGTTK